jgi:hypothetical protein
LFVSLTAFGAENCLAAGVNWPSFFDGLAMESIELRTIPEKKNLFII